MNKTNSHPLKHYFRKYPEIPILSILLLCIAIIVYPLISASNKTVGIAMGYEFLEIGDDERKEQLKEIRDAGFSHVRFVISWNLVQPESSSEFEWKKYDRIFDDLEANDLRAVGVLLYTPEWARDQACLNSALCQPQNPHEFGSFAREVAARYMNRGLSVYEVWNEPNLKRFWQPAPSPERYTSTLRAAYSSIKEVDRDAYVLTAGLSGVSVAGDGYVEPRDYLQDMYAHGVQGSFDGLAYHPYTFPTLPEYEDSKNAWAKMDTKERSLRQIMTTNGDPDKDIWITEFGAPTSGPGTAAQIGSPPGKVDHVSESLQRLQAERAIHEFAEKPWLRGLFWYTWKDISSSRESNENFYGLNTYTGEPKPALNVFIDYLTK